jgi:hypothetical protein
MIIPCEILINILEKAMMPVKNHYGCLSNECLNAPCISDFTAGVDQILILKAVSKQWKTVLDKFLVDKHLKQMLFLHEQITNYLPYPRFVLYKTGNEPFHLGLHPFQVEGVLQSL